MGSILPATWTLGSGQSGGRGRCHVCAGSDAGQTQSREQVWVMGTWWSGSRWDECHSSCISAPDQGCCCLLSSVLRGCRGEQPLRRASAASLGKTISLKNPKGSRGRAAAACTQAHTACVQGHAHTRPARAQSMLHRCAPVGACSGC